jgi:hypothetical protein
LYDGADWMNVVQDREELQAFLKLAAVNFRELCYVVLVKITLSFCLIKHHSTKTYWGLEV